MDAVAEHGVKMLPVDSEHSAIFQCLEGNEGRPVKKILLTASGGPFRGYSLEELEKVTLEQALKPPKWTMGAKITIDSATMMNQGLEVIEAKWLFGVEADDIQILVHPQSIVHSGVEFSDGATLVQMGLPDMRVPIAYAMSYPERLPDVSPRMDLTKVGTLTFEKPDFERFPALGLAYRVLKEGGTAPVILNGANEIAVQMVLEKKLAFFRIAELLEKTLDSLPVVKEPTVEDIYAADRAARDKALEIMQEWMA